MSTIQSPFPTIKKTRFEINPRQPISVKDFLRGLKRPSRTLLEALPAKSGSCRVLSPAKTVHDDSHIPDPPESDHQQVFEDLQQGQLSPTATSKFEAPLWRHPNDDLESKYASKVVRTYAKRKKPPTMPAKKQIEDSPSVFCSDSAEEAHDSPYQSPEIEPILLQNQLPKTKSRCKGKVHGNGTIRGRGQMLPTTRRRRHTALTEAVEFNPDPNVDLRPPASPELGDDNVISITAKKTKRKRSKGRRVPLNELPLVPQLPIQENISSRPKQGTPILDLPSNGPTDRQDTSPNITTTIKKTSTGQPVTRLRRDISIPKQRSISHEGFKFPPATPKATRSRGWRLGSGFEGVRLDTTHGKDTIAPYKKTIRRSNTPRFTTSALRPLELSAAISPTARKMRHGLHLNGDAQAMTSEQDGCVLSGQPLEEAFEAAARQPIGDTAADCEALNTQLRTLITLLRPRKEAPALETSGISQIAPMPGRMVSRPAKASVFREEDLGRSQSTRQPSKSERNGWLKRRRKVSFADLSDLGSPEKMTRKPQKDRADNADNLFEAHNAVWYNDTRLNPRRQYLANKCRRVRQREAIEEGEDILNNGPFQTPTHGRFMFQRLDDNIDEAETSPTRQPITRVPSAQFQAAASSRPPEVQDSQEQRETWGFPRQRGYKPLDTSGIKATASAAEQRDNATQSEKTWLESLDLCERPDILLREPTINGGRYFSNAVQQLSSPEKGLRNVPRRKSHTAGDYGSSAHKAATDFVPLGFGVQQGAYGVSVSPNKGRRPSQMEQGSLELGMTPRLRR